jgi:hypothetical protein
VENFSVVALFSIDNVSIKIYNEVKEEVRTMIALAEYAAKHGKSHVAARKMAARGGFKTAVKIARNWIIDENEPYPDARIKTGEYINWRNKAKRGE